MNIFESFKKNGNKFLEKTLVSVFKGMDKESIDIIFLEFLQAFDIEGANLGNLDNMKKKNFHSYVANEIVKQLITGVQKKKLTDLMSELKRHDSFFVNEIDSVKEEELESNKGTISREIFMEVEKLTPDALTLLALIKVDQNDFQESYNSLAGMWRDLFKDPKNEEDKKRVRRTARYSVAKALDELENLMIVENQSNQKNAEDYCKTKYKTIKKELKKYSVKEEELDADIQNQLKKLKKTEFSQKEKIDEVAIRITDDIRSKKIERELNNLLKSYKEDLPLKKKKRLLNKLISFTKKNILSYQQSYQKKKEKVDSLIKQLELDESSYQSFLENNNFPLAAKSMIGFYLLVATIVILKKLPRVR